VVVVGVETKETDVKNREARCGGGNLCNGMKALGSGWKMKMSEDGMSASASKRWRAGYFYLHKFLSAFRYSALRNVRRGPIF
jgi:hypothetical protein